MLSSDEAGYFDRTTRLPQLEPHGGTVTVTVEAIDEILEANEYVVRGVPRTPTEVVDLLFGDEGPARHRRFAYPKSGHDANCGCFDDDATDRMDVPGLNYAGGFVWTQDVEHLQERQSIGMAEAQRRWPPMFAEHEVLHESRVLAEQMSQYAQFAGEAMAEARRRLTPVINQMFGYAPDSDIDVVWADEVGRRQRRDALATLSPVTYAILDEITSGLPGEAIHDA